MLLGSYGGPRRDGYKPASTIILSTVIPDFMAYGRDVKRPATCKNAQELAEYRQ